MRDPELVVRAQRAATRLESAWEQWRALHGLADAPGQPVVSYVGYSLKEPWGEPRVVIGIDAGEAEFLAEFLDRDESAQRGQVPLQQAQRQQHQQAQQAQHQQAQQVPLQQAQQVPLQQAQQVPLQQARHQQVQQVPPQQAQHQQVQQVPLQTGPLQSGPLQQVKLTEPVPEGTGEYPGPGLLNAPPVPGRGRPSPDQGRDLAAEIVGWTPGELPGQISEHFVSWPPGIPSAADQPPASA